MNAHEVPPNSVAAPPVDDERAELRATISRLKGKLGEVRELTEKIGGPPKWTRVLNRTGRREVIFRRGEDKPQRSRTRRRINRIERQKGNYA